MIEQVKFIRSVFATFDVFDSLLNDFSDFGFKNIAVLVGYQVSFRPWLQLVLVSKEKIVGSDGSRSDLLEEILEALGYGTRYVDLSFLKLFPIFTLEFEFHGNMANILTSACYCNDVLGEDIFEHLGDVNNCDLVW